MLNVIIIRLGTIHEQFQMEMVDQELKLIRQRKKWLHMLLIRIFIRLSHLMIVEMWIKSEL